MSDSKVLVLSSWVSYKEMAGHFFEGLRSFRAGDAIYRP